MSQIKVKPVISPRIVQPSDPWRIWLWVLLLILLAGLAWQSFDIGRIRGGYDHSRATQERNTLQDMILQQRDEYSALSLDTAKYQRASQVNSEAIRQSKTDMMALFSERSELKKEVGFLRGLISSQSGPVYIKDFRLTASSDELLFRYTFLLGQALDDFGVTRGNLQVIVVGEIDGKKKQLQQTTEKFSFVSYQEMSAEIRLPTDFEAQYLQLDIKLSSRKIKDFSKNFAWEPVSDGDQ